jgi:hypothetical protein
LHTVDVFSALALLLACVGLYGCSLFPSFNGVRRWESMALGANRADVIWTVMREALMWSSPA